MSPLGTYSCDDDALGSLSIQFGKKGIEEIIDLDGVRCRRSNLKSSVENRFAPPFHNLCYIAFLHLLVDEAITM